MTLQDRFPQKPLSLHLHNNRGTGMANLLAGLQPPDTGTVKMNGQIVTEPGPERGILFQNYSLLPWLSVYDNVALAPRLAGIKEKAELDVIVEQCLMRAALWDEVKDRLDSSALRMSGGQQQRLCIARAIAAEPDVLLLDEPCSALDPIATGRIEELIADLKGRYSIFIVTHNMQQASRSSDYTAFMYLGRLVEYGATSDIFLSPRLKETEDYVTGRFG